MNVSTNLLGVALSEEEIITEFKNFLLNFSTIDEKGKPSFPYLNVLEAIFDRQVRSISISYSDLVLFSPRLAKLLLESPRESLKIFAKALQEVIKELHPEIPEKILRTFRIRIKNVGGEVPIRALFLSSYVGRIVEFRALVVRATQVKQFLRRALYLCDVCGRMFPFESQEFYTKPRACIYPDCNNNNPTKIRLMPDGQEFEEYQELVVQELPEELPAGKLPESCTLILYGDLVDKVRPGDRIKVTGIILTEPERKLIEGKRPLYKTYVEAVHLEKTETEEEELKLTEEELQEILALKNDPDLEKKIYESIAPSIHGLNFVKKAIAAQLFGGVPKVYPDGTRVRGDIHILLIGDPGTAKSQLLKYVSILAPRAIYTSGKGASAAGLTAAVVKTEDGWALEAGVMVLADRGVACIDEFDKMREEDRRAIHEALEQQTVSIAKAGIVATLNARTSVLAAANPKYGRYYPNRGLKDNIDLPPPILSRFDLIFVIKDMPSEEYDKALAEHILNIHGKYKSPIPPIPPKLFKKLILYAREHITPKLSREAMEKLKEFYLEMRKSAGRFQSDSLEMHPVPITPRHLEALVRLAEAHARMLLKEVADEKDADFAIHLMAESLKQVAYDVESGVLDVSAIYTGETFSQRSRYMIVLDTIRKLQNEFSDGIPINEIIQRCEAKGIPREFVLQVIQKEKMRGELYEKKPGHILFVT
ncbi:MAG: minichromosome maintenance protein MCM [Candidatus Korarchaeota archaeon]|nr:minichromosome maintenance protein MCM [Thermoproteota archaeon]MCR8463163.1 minichromosome maintenance protein MCM [Thermoproteota archaeon]MCR8470495.1 minichromosome maintenance protein MCM [Thermoproteota archaeon]MCR8471854.1 minichromosome maintenance protein MCM [Thermoproteota archaeon]MCR8472830.1 minichromosome maintenance protein MCM [Thermoproteota archaeon]